MATAQKFKHTSVPRQAGERARLKVVQGPDSGAVYVITGERASVGRGEENDVIVSDLKTSRSHAEILFSGSSWSVKDLGSANGILVNGKNVRSADLKANDVLALGETTLEFLTAEAGTRMLQGPARSPEQVAADQAQKKKVRSLAGMMGSATAAGAGKKGPKPLLIGAVAVGALFMLLPEDKPESAPKAKKAEKSETRSLASYLPKAESPEAERTAEMFFRTGFREFRSRNYLRAKMQFETVLQMSPGHSLATLYLENCNMEIEQEIKDHLEIGKRSLSAGKLKGARWHFEAVMRLLERDQANPAFIEASDQFKAVDRMLKGEDSA